MKHIVQATQPIVLMDPNNGQIVEQKPSLITHTQFIAVRIGLGEIKILVADVPDEATNEEFQKFIVDSEGNHDLAIDSFMSQYKPELVPFNAQKLEPEVAPVPVVEPVAEPAPEPIAAPAPAAAAKPEPKKAK